MTAMTSAEPVGMAEVEHNLRCNIQNLRLMVTQIKEISEIIRDHQSYQHSGLRGSEMILSVSSSLSIQTLPGAGLVGGSTLL